MWCVRRKTQNWAQTGSPCYELSCQTLRVVAVDLKLPVEEACVLLSFDRRNLDLRIATGRTTRLILRI